MKKIIFVLATLVSTCAFADSVTTCAGGVWLKTAFVPFPIHKQATITIRPSLADLQHNPSSAQVTVDVGGDPAVYQGPVDLTGVKPQTETDPANGDIYSFQMKALPHSKISYSAKFMDSKMALQGEVKQATLDCK